MHENATDFDVLFAQAKASDTEAKALETSHFRNDCLYIVERLQSNVHLMPGLVCFVLLTIQQQFTWMERQVADVAKNGMRSRFLFGWKPDGYAYAQANKQALHKAARQAYQGEISLADLILEYLAVPGLGIVKASFLAQMSVGNGACLDTVNLQRLGMDQKAFVTPKGLKVESIRKRIKTYQAVCDAHGDSAYWWDIWCDTLASRQTIDTGKRNAIGEPILRRIAAFETGAHASLTHRLAVDGGIR